MNLIKNIFQILLISLICSCSNTSGEKENTKPTAIKEKKSGSGKIDDEVSKQMAEMFGSDAETFHDLMKTDSLQGEMMKIFSEEGFAEILKNSKLSDKEQQAMLKKVKDLRTANTSSSGKNLQNATKEKMDAYFKELSTVLAASGSEKQLKDLQAMMQKENINDQLSGLSTEKPGMKIQNIRKVLATDKPSFVEEDLTKKSFYGATEKRKLMRELASASQKEGKTAIAKYYDISENELELLKLLPHSTKLTSVKVAETVTGFSLPAQISTYLSRSNPSPKFKILASNYIRDTKLQAQQFIDRAQYARKEFYDKNPGWYGEKGETGDTYIDSRSKFVYLPLASLSFADKVVAHELGNPPGSHKTGALGEPDMSTEIFDRADPKICNLGERGRLTLEFTDNALTDVNGDDLYVFEMGRIEPTILEISKNGKDWINVGRIEGGTAKVDIGPFIQKGEAFNYVRLTDLASRSELPGADVDAVAAIGGALRLNLDAAVLFSTGKFQLKEGASGELQKLMAAIKKIPKALIIIEGHTDNVGNPSANNILSEKRADEVAGYLKKNLPSTYSLQTKGYGESQPIAPNDSDENRQKNRRVEILVMPR